VEWCSGADPYHPSASTAQLLKVFSELEVQDAGKRACVANLFFSLSRIRDRAEWATYRMSADADAGGWMRERGKGGMGADWVDGPGLGEGWGGR
jgi:hypothetical protein